MKAIQKTYKQTGDHHEKSVTPSLETAISNCWLKIAPFWPLKNLIAVNPVAGFEDYDFENALNQANAYFQQKDMPEQMQKVNRLSIKWLQVFFDNGQATIRMPQRDLGLLKSVSSLLRFDNQINLSDSQNKKWLENVSHKPEKLIAEALFFLGISSKDQEQFLTLMLTTLPGWASYLQYLTSWAYEQNANPFSKNEYLALRMLLTCLIWPEAKVLLEWHRNALKNADAKKTTKRISDAESEYQNQLIKQFSSLKCQQTESRPKAQFIFCIDVRSEPFRRALEAQGDYMTYGFAGFFGVPVKIKNIVTGESRCSCPVLLKPAHTITEKPVSAENAPCRGFGRLQTIKKIYQSLKYTFTTPFSLAEAAGLATGLWMTLRSFCPDWSSKLKSLSKKLVSRDYSLSLDISSISLDQQVHYARSALKIIGLTENFAPFIFLCAHGSTTQNNAFATALDCGACGGQHGAANATVLASILNSAQVRRELRKNNIIIQEDTVFLAAEHNTTTDQMEIYTSNSAVQSEMSLELIKKDLEKARIMNCQSRSAKMGINLTELKAKKHTLIRSEDWAQVRPEWGLARNAAFIVGPRWLTKNIDLDGRAFLHSYDWQKDSDRSSLTAIMTAPMIVAQWINAQYLFSTLDNVAFGAGSKITKNITGKIGIMQGNASDLMHGLPMQSLYKADNQPYHQPMRLTVVIHAPCLQIDSIVSEQPLLQKLFRNGWLKLICFDPETEQKLIFKQDLSWQSHSDRDCQLSFS